MPVDPALLEDMEFFRLLDDADRRALAEVVDLVKLDDNQTLFRAGEPGESLFLVRSGEVELFIKDNTGQKIILDITREGDFFGEIALLDEGPRTATAQALTESELIELDREDLMLLVRRKPESALHMLAAMGKMTRKADELLRTRVSRNVNTEVEEQLTRLQKIADWLAWFSGSMPFLMVHTIWFLIWIPLNTPLLGPLFFKPDADGKYGFDPFPFGLLTMIVSLEAIFLACFVLISQNRQAQKDKVRSDVEYDVNIKAELEVAELHQKTDHMHEEMMRRFSTLEKLLARRAPPAEKV
jgi:CRP/FNR family transcriptional regulator, cyclic AMP receptor protein